MEGTARANDQPLLLLAQSHNVLQGRYLPLHPLQRAKPETRPDRGSGQPVWSGARRRRRMAPTVFLLRPTWRPISRRLRPSPESSATLAAFRSDGRWPTWRPSFLPRALAFARPEVTRSRMRSRSNSASAAITDAIILPCGVDRSNCRPEMARTEMSQACNDCSVWT